MNGEVAVPMIIGRLNKKMNGEVAEWLNAHAWKACLRKRNEGSNPSLSASYGLSHVRKIVKSTLLYVSKVRPRKVLQLETF